MTRLSSASRLARRLLILPGLYVALSGCSSDADLSKETLGDTRDGTAPLQPEAASDGSVQSPWWCLGQSPPALPTVRPASQPVAVVLPVVDWATLQPLAGRGLTATLCPGTLFQCSQPLVGPYVVQDRAVGTIPLPAGAAGIPAPEGFDGFIQLKVSDSFGGTGTDSYLPVDYYLGAPISGEVTQGQAVAMFTRRNWQTAIVQSFSGTDPSVALTSGTLAVGVFDCDGQPVTGARVEISVAGGLADGIRSFVMPSSRIPVAQAPGEPLITGSSGIVGYLGMPPGALQLHAYLPGETQPFASTELGAVAGELSVAALRPAYLATADLRGAPHIAP